MKVIKVLNWKPIKLIFSLPCVVYYLYSMILFVKETKGVVLENMDSVFESNTEKTKQK